MKKFLFAATLIFGIIFAQLPAAQASDVFVGTSPATGMDCYLMTETVTKYCTTENGKGFNARLKMVGRTVQYLDYELFIRYNGTCRFSNSSYSGEATPSGTPIEWNMCKYIAQNYF